MDVGLAASALMFKGRVCLGWLQWGWETFFIL